MHNKEKIQIMHNLPLDYAKCGIVLCIKKLRLCIIKKIGQIQIIHDTGKVARIYAPHQKVAGKSFWIMRFCIKFAADTDYT